MEGKHRIIRVMSVLVCWEKPLLLFVHLYQSFYLEMQVCSKYYIHEHIITLCSEVAIFMLSLGTYLKTMTLICPCSVKSHHFCCGLIQVQYNIDQYSAENTC